MRKLDSPTKQNHHAPRTECAIVAKASCNCWMIKHRLPRNQGCTLLTWFAQHEVTMGALGLLPAAAINQTLTNLVAEE